MPGNLVFPRKVNPLNLKYLCQAKNIPGVQTKNPIKICGKSVQAFMSKDPKETAKTPKRRQILQRDSKDSKETAKTPKRRQRPQRDGKDHKEAEKTPKRKQRPQGDSKDPKEAAKTPKGQQRDGKDPKETAKTCEQ